MRTILVTGGAGFIGSAVCRHLIGRGDTRVINFDKLTYAGNPASLTTIAGSPLYHFVEGDIGDTRLVADLLGAMRPDAILHLAAESHVDRSIDGPGAFVETNVVGTFRLLSEAPASWSGLAGAAKAGVRVGRSRVG